MSYEETPEDAWEMRYLPQIEARSGAKLWWQVRVAFEDYMVRDPAGAMALARRCLEPSVASPAAWLNTLLRSEPEGAKLSGPPSNEEDPRCQS